jgi:hypothetical protein
MNELPTISKLEGAIRENANSRTIMAWLQYQEKELAYKLKKTRDANDFRFIQGQLNILDNLIELLTKAVS